MINPKIGASYKKLVAIFGQSRKIPLKGDYFYAKKAKNSHKKKGVIFYEFL